MEEAEIDILTTYKYFLKKSARVKKCKSVAIKTKSASMVAVTRLD